MKMYIFSIIAIPLALINSSCDSGIVNETKDLNIDNFKKEHHIELCDQSRVEYSEEISETLKKFWKGYIIKFPDEFCLKKFLSYIEENSSIYQIVDDSGQYRSQGITKNIHFMINKLGDKELEFLVKE